MAQRSAERNTRRTSDASENAQRARANRAGLYSIFTPLDGWSHRRGVGGRASRSDALEVVGGGRVRSSGDTGRMSGLRSRRKGVTGERELADVFEDAGWTTRGLEGSGDWLAFRSRTVPYAEDTLHIECKRAERLRLPAWLAQAAAEAPADVPPVVCFRQSRGQWYAALPLTDLLELIG